MHMRRRRRENPGFYIAGFFAIALFVVIGHDFWLETWGTPVTPWGEAIDADYDPAWSSPGYTTTDGYWVPGTYYPERHQLLFEVVREDGSRDLKWKTVPALEYDRAVQALNQAQSR